MDARTTSPVTWSDSLDLLLSQRKAEPGEPLRLAIVGVGNPMRSDDAAGILVARALSQRECATDTEQLLILEAGPSPENAAGQLRRFAPGFILIVDAVDMGQTPGTIQWIEEEAIAGMSVSTHSLPLSVLAHYLRLELNCAVTFLGIQVSSNEVGQRVNPDVLQAVDEIVDELDKSLCLR